MRNIGILLYGSGGQIRDAATEDKYKLLVERLAAVGWQVRTLSYHASRERVVLAEASSCEAMLVWINPVEPELDREALDRFLRDLSNKGVLVSAHPDTILKIGTKDILVESQSLGWSVETVAYRSIDEFRTQFPRRARRDGPRVLKQHRGNSGQGVWKISAEGSGFVVQSAVRNAPPETITEAALLSFFDREVFTQGSHLVDQAWVPTMTRGMVRAYLCGTKVAGFGYQEINALYPTDAAERFTRRVPSKRHYYTEQCSLFQPLRDRLDKSWLPALAAKMGLSDADFPLLWDADFFFGDPPKEYLLCEINVSCVSPFPESAIAPLIRDLTRRLKSRGSESGR